MGRVERVRPPIARALEALTAINLDDLVSSFGGERSAVWSSALRQVFRFPAAVFARQMLAFDAQVADQGLSGASAVLLRRFVRSLKVSGAQHIPPSGPVLFLSNHPGMVDTLALFAAIPRPDLRILALARPFLKALTNTSGQIIFLENGPSRLTALSATSAHLRRGGAALTFPAGKIEPDPDVYPGAVRALDDWSPSADFFARRAPQTRIIPTLVRGVLWDRAVRFPLTRLRRLRDDRERLGACLQLLGHIVLAARPLDVKVHFGAPLTLSDLGSDRAGDLSAAVKRRMAAMIDEAGP
jgi:1-acyl-sn-glycerol-3-phosphate acyltransferase